MEPMWLGASTQEGCVWGVWTEVFFGELCLCKLLDAYVYPKAKAEQDH